MSTIDLEACLILEMLSARIPDASIDYEGGGGLHRFLVLCHGLKYELSFNERLLNAFNVEDIKNALRIVVECVRRHAAPRRIKFGAVTEHVAAAVCV